MRSAMRRVLGVIALACGLAACSQESASPASSAKPTEKTGRFAKPVIIGTDAAYPPMESVNAASGAIEGFDVDFIREVAKRGGFEVEVRNTDWKAIFGALEVRDIDAIISSVTITDERKQKYDFSKSYLIAAQRLVVRRTDEAKIPDLPQLEGKKVGAQIGTTGALLLEKQFPRIQLVTYDAAPLGFTDLESGTIEAFLVDEAVAVEFTRLKPETKDKFSLSPKRYSDEEYGIVVRKGDTELLDRINAGVKAAKEAGVDRDLQEKWLR